jgi:hypothetical protein
MNETLKVFGLITLFAVVYGAVSDDDYHKMFDKTTVIRYNCDMLIGGWHPDVPREVIEKCRNPRERTVKITKYSDT